MRTWVILADAHKAVLSVTSLLSSYLTTATTETEQAGQVLDNVNMADPVTNFKLLVYQVLSSPLSNCRQCAIQLLKHYVQGQSRIDHYEDPYTPTLLTRLRYASIDYETIDDLLRILHMDHHHLELWLHCLQSPQTWSSIKHGWRLALSGQHPGVVGRFPPLEDQYEQSLGSNEWLIKLNYVIGCYLCPWDFAPHDTPIEDWIQLHRDFLAVMDVQDQRVKDKIVDQPCQCPHGLRAAGDTDISGWREAAEFNLITDSYILEPVRSDLRRAAVGYHHRANSLETLRSIWTSPYFRQEVLQPWASRGIALEIERLQNLIGNRRPFEMVTNEEDADVDPRVVALEELEPRRHSGSSDDFSSDDWDVMSLSP